MLHKRGPLARFPFLLNFKNSEASLVSDRGETCVACHGISHELLASTMAIYKSFLALLMKEKL